MATNFPRVDLFSIMRKFYDYSFDNPDKIKPTHIAIYFFAIDKNNRLGWKEKFGIPTEHAMEATGIRSKNTYYKAFHGLVDMGLIKIIEMSRNQNTANIISIPAVSKFKSVDVTAGRSALDLTNIQQRESESNIDIQSNQDSNSQGGRFKLRYRCN